MVWEQSENSINRKNFTVIMENIKGATAELQIVHHFKLSTSIPTFESNFTILIIFLCMALPAGNPPAFLSSQETRQPGHTFIGSFVTRIRKSQGNKGKRRKQKKRRIFIWTKQETAMKRRAASKRWVNRWVEDYNRHIHVKGYLGFAEKCPEIIFEWRNFALNPEKKY